MKRLILCLDGTWNSADARERYTNVVWLRDAIAGRCGDPPVQQRIYYDEGVGTGSLGDRIFGGGTGAGLGMNVLQAYRYIARHYEPGDDIHLIGFSRGAYAARSVAGLIAAAGLLRSDSMTRENERRAWDCYRTDPKDRLIGEDLKLRPLCHPDVRIKSVAVFDTVGALGIPISKLSWVGRERFAFHDTRLGGIIENAFHAVAIDEKRTPFRATMWERPFNPSWNTDGQRVEQVWFPGVHSDIGGSYAENELSRIALHWMVGRLRSAGVGFENATLARLGVDQPPLKNATGTLHESRTMLYTWDRVRPYLRPIAGIAANAKSRQGDETLLYDPIGERLHVSALDRYGQREEGPPYRPPNLARVLGKVADGLLPVVDWEGTILPRAALLARYEAILRADMGQTNSSAGLASDAVQAGEPLGASAAGQGA